MADSPPLWIFGYGSLVWRPAFEHVTRVPGFITGWSRRFWQASTDHRGVPGAPGRVVTLVPDPQAATWGMAYQVDPAVREEVLARLDHREKGGYSRESVHVQLRDGGRLEDVLVYRATETNPQFLGPAPLADIARQIHRSHGPSGPNPEYLIELARALRALGVEDAHVFELEAALRELQKAAG